MEKFSLVFSTNPSSGNVVRRDGIMEGSMAPGEKVKFKHLVSETRKEYDISEGVVIAVGLKKNMERIFLDTNGNITAEESERVGTRKQELAKIKLRQNRALTQTLQGVAEGILNGDDGDDPTERPPPNRLPTKRSPAELAALQAKLDNLPCFKWDPSKSELLIGKGVYIDQEKLICTRQSLSELPETHFNTLMRHFLKPVFGIKGISATGTRHCVGIPDKLTSTVLRYVTQMYVNRANGRKEDVTFNHIKKIRNLLSNYNDNKPGQQRSSANFVTFSTPREPLSPRASSSSNGHEHSYCSPSASSSNATFVENHEIQIHRHTDNFYQDEEIVLADISKSHVTILPQNNW